MVSTTHQSLNFGLGFFIWGKHLSQDDVVESDYYTRTSMTPFHSIITAQKFQQTLLQVNVIEIDPEKLINGALTATLDGTIDL